MSIEKNLKDYLYMFKGHVKHVVDGDSLDVNIDHGMRVNSLNRLRLLGLDTPERGEDGYLEAKSFVFEKVMDKDVNDMVVTQLFDGGKKSIMHHSGYRAEILPLGHGLYKLSIIDGVEIKSYSGTISYDDIRLIYLKEKIIDIIECADLIHVIPMPRHVVSGGF